jgi:hypothetical protein
MQQGSGVPIREAAASCTTAMTVARSRVDLCHHSTSVQDAPFVRWALSTTPRPLMSDRRTLLHQTADLAADFLEGLPSRPVRASASHEELVASMGGA